MISPSASSPTSAPSRRASKACAIAATLLLSCLLTSCASDSSAAKALPAQLQRPDLQLYQPRVLRLPAGQEVPTLDGKYRPQVDEVWHSAAAFNQLEQENINLNAALAQLRARQ